MFGGFGSGVSVSFDEQPGWSPPLVELPASVTAFARTTDVTSGSELYMATGSGIYRIHF